jgi:hypothetical protein
MSMQMKLPSRKVGINDIPCDHHIQLQTYRMYLNKKRFFKKAFFIDQVEGKEK